MVAPDWPYSGHMSTLWAGRWGEGISATYSPTPWLQRQSCFLSVLGFPHIGKMFGFWKAKVRNIFWNQRGPESASAHLPQPVSSLAEPRENPQQFLYLLERDADISQGFRDSVPARGHCGVRRGPPSE